MLKYHGKYDSEQGKRLILIADDEWINREMLGNLLQDQYDILFAEDGQEALEKIRENREILSLILLDLMMPKLNGTELLKIVKADSELQSIPVIVITSDQKSEVECLTLGAVDFIPKPYPQPEVIRARVLRTIELSEDRQIISSTERDPLTGLYNKEYFYRYVEQMDLHHKNTPADAIYLNINHFHIINERFGTAFADDVLRRVGESLKESVEETGGIVCRREADTFLLYCPSGLDYAALQEKASISFTEDGSHENRLRIRMGVYSEVDKSLNVLRRFDRAKIAADMVRNNYTRPFGLYDDTMHEKELYSEQLIEDFRRALKEKQFQVFYQPKFDVRPDVPILASAEALVRWKHPDLGMISPGVFIPLFEENGMIQALDNYVWWETAAQIRRWKDEFGETVPVSVNVSRVDMHEPELPEMFQSILKENGISAEDFLLEITESAYTQDSEQIISTVNTLRKLGFRIEMDDFGTGYSSLNMISSLPVDALKLDMQFIRSAFRDGRDTRMLEVIIDIAGYLSVPVIAEGVETEEQLSALRELGCDLVQGYYFSKPVPAEEFRRFLVERLEQKKADAEAAAKAEEERKKVGREAIEALQTQEDEDKEDPEEGQIPVWPGQMEAVEEKKDGITMRLVSYLFVILAFVTATGLFASDFLITKGYQRMETASDRYLQAKLAAQNLEAASDALTESVRAFTVTGELKYLQEYFEEAEVTRRRDNALDDLETLLEGSGSEAYGSLSTALDYSNELMEREYLAMRLTQAAMQYGDEGIPDAVLSVVPENEELNLTADEQLKRARDLVFDDEYQSYKQKIRENVKLCTDQLIDVSSRELGNASRSLDTMLTAQTVLTITLLLLVLLLVIYISTQVRRPLEKMVKRMRIQKPIPPSGAAELQFVTRTYNGILQDNLKKRQQLTYEASHDALTGLYNRSAYEMFMGGVDDHIALLIVDVDRFKQVNDTYGHDVGDRVLKKVADILRHSFRSVDIICRIGGDEFVVIMTRANSSMSQMVVGKINHANELLQNPGEGLPKVSLSVGVAFSDRKNPQGDIFKDADTALYRVKEAGRNGCAVY